MARSMPGRKTSNTEKLLTVGLLGAMGKQMYDRKQLPFQEKGAPAPKTAVPVDATPVVAGSGGSNRGPRKPVGTAPTSPTKNSPLTVGSIIGRGESQDDAPGVDSSQKFDVPNTVPTQAAFSAMPPIAPVAAPDNRNAFIKSPAPILPDTSPIYGGANGGKVGKVASGGVRFPKKG